MKEIKGLIKNYDWGTEDFLPQMLGLPSTGEPFAEYWLGSSPDGERTRFLFKVLSIAKPLSIQCHPSDEQAKAAFEAGNSNYSGPNGKPEVVCALTPMKLRVGIRDGVDEFDVLDILYNHQKDLDAYLDSIMNTVYLEPGQAVYTAPGTLHQYLEGNAVELMNWSDNVIRGGMTSKHVDIPELARICNFEGESVQILGTSADKAGRVVFNAPCDKFVLKMAGQGSFEIKEDRDTIALVVDGKAEFSGVKYNRGSAVFISAGESYSLENSGCVFFAS